MTFAHIPVLKDEVLKWLDVKPNARIVDGTVGGGGHAQLILQACDSVELLGIDRDAEAIAAASRNLAEFAQRVHLLRTRFSNIISAAAQVGWQEVDGILLDVGISSHQIDVPARGFSFRHDGPLDMRMDRQCRLTAATILNTYGEDRLRSIFREYGEEPRAAAVAREVIRRRAEKPFSRTKQFADLLEQVASVRRGRKLPPPTRCFQALRIAVNEELDELTYAISDAVTLLKKGGRLVVISFHSLEDRIVKNAFRDAASNCLCPPDFPVCRCHKKATLKILTRKPVSATAKEIDENRRAGSARLRAAEKI